jgi:hypothetical protein
MLTPRFRGWLRHKHYDVYDGLEINPRYGIDTSDNGIPMQFEMNNAGDINAVTLDLQPGLKPIEFTRQPRPKEISKDELNKYTGTFEFTPGREAKFYLKGDKTLYLFVEGQPEYELVPVDKGKFSLKSLTGYTVQFSEDDKGEISSCSFIQPNGTFKATKKK